jgi:hypothetical protein
MFHASLKRMPDDMKGQFTQYPHPNHPSLASLFRRCYELYEIDPTRAPTIFFIQEGDHEAGGRMDIKYTMKIIGAGRDKTFVRGGGFKIQGTKEERKNVVLKDMTISETSENGVWCDGGLSLLCDSLTITQCEYHGVYAHNTKGRLINCVITQCGRSGICCSSNALIEVEGDQTKVHGNVTCGDSSSYGLKTSDTSSTIHLLFPLTKESVSTNTHGGNNYNSRGTIKTVDALESL